MTRQTLRHRAIGRATVGLLTAASVVVLAPVAAASPETDAGDAINRAWQDTGGPGGRLGAPDGGVYPVGDGFGQNFAGGKIFFTAATGARIMQGAILEKYQSLGGPADSDLGFPTIDEGPGKVSPDSRNTTFSASDNPVIFWTPDNGAHVVRGAINAAWDKLGGSAGTLGVPVEDETYNGDAVTQKFTRGEVSWNRQTKTFTTVPPELAGQLAGLVVPEDATSAINAARRAAGGPLGPLGAKQGPQYAVGPDGAGQNFAGGKIFYSPASGANVITGQVLAKYESVGGPMGDLGFPTSNEVDGGLAPASRMSTFAADDRPVIFWTPDYGAVIVRGAMNAAWNKLGGATGTLGAPVADQTEKGDVVTQKFSGGAISWNRATKTFTTEPSNLASSLSGLQVPGEVPKAPPSAASNNNGNKLFAWHWWWLLAIIPVVVLVALVSGAVLHRRRRHDDFGLPALDEAVPAAAGFRSAGPDERYRAADWDFGGEDVDAIADEREAPLGEAPDEVDAAYWPQDHPDAEDTEPNRIQAAPSLDGGRHEAPDAEETVNTAIHLPLDDPYQAPDGYPIKADTKSGQYWAPGSGLYDVARAEIWFASEELARANGFTKAE